MRFIPRTRGIINQSPQDLYIKILLWAHSTQETGFTWDDMKDRFSLNTLQERWVRKIFLTTSDNDRKFFELLRDDGTSTSNKHYYSLNEKGMSAAVSYMSLKQSEKSSKYALWFAGLSLLISAWQFLTPINIGPVCYGSASVGDKITHKSCVFIIKIGQVLNLSLDTSYNIQ